MDAAPTTAFDVPLIPFSSKQGQYLFHARLGYWPAEQRVMRDPAYANPTGFIPVTPATRFLPVGRHFALGDFAMHDGEERGYVVLKPTLVEKLELVMAQLGTHGGRRAEFTVLSGFRAPSYNAGVEGSAPSSRHQFGDAADVIVDADGDGRMDDLDGDGRVDADDIRVLAAAVERVESRYPSLVGGLGLYMALGHRGPFAHIDVRGHAARWGTATRWPANDGSWQPTRRGSSPAPYWPRSQSAAVGRCQATGASAVLCVSRRRD